MWTFGYWPSMAIAEWMMAMTPTHPSLFAGNNMKFFAFIWIMGLVLWVVARFGSYIDEEETREKKERQEKRGQASS